MRVKAQRWMNSLVVPIPKAVADQAGSREQHELDIEVTKGGIQLRPRTFEPDLNELLNGISAKNIHVATDFRRPAGG